MTTVCNHCQNTGELGSAGYLDCTECGAAEARTAMNAFVASLGNVLTPHEVYWLVHQRAVNLTREAL